MAVYNERYCIPAFGNVLRKFWILDNLANAGASEPKFALPNGCFTIAFISGAGITIANGAGTATIKPGIYLFGQLTSKLSISVKPFTKAIMAQLHPWAAAFFTSLPLHEITNTFIDFQEVNSFLNKQFKAINLADEDLVINQVYKSLGASLGSSVKPGLLTYLCQHMQANNQNDSFRLANLSAQLGYSERFIQKKFKNQIGLTPKEYYLIVRLRHLLQELNIPHHYYSLTELALQYGFYDQSHFIKTFYRIMQISPKHYLAQDYILPFAESH